MPAARQRAMGRACLKPDPADAPHIIKVRVARTDPRTGPVKYPPSSKTIARMKAKAEETARNAAAARALARQVQPGLQPLAGGLFVVDVAGLVLRGPAGGIDTSERMVRTLAPLSAGGRHLPAALAAAGAWKDEAALRKALDVPGPKLSAIGLRICRRKTGPRMAGYCTK